MRHIQIKQSTLHITQRVFVAWYSTKQHTFSKINIHKIPLVVLSMLCLNVPRYILFATFFVQQSYPAM